VANVPHEWPAVSSLQQQRVSSSNRTSIPETARPITAQPPSEGRTTINLRDPQRPPTTLVARSLGCTGGNNSRRVGEQEDASVHWMGHEREQIVVEAEDVYERVLFGQVPVLPG